MLVDKRPQVLANCKYLYGPDIEVITLSFAGRGYHAVAMKFDRYTGQWTKLLHGRVEKTSIHAISSLLCETETKIANLFSANGISYTLFEDPEQIMTLPKVVDHSAVNRNGQSQNSSSESIVIPYIEAENIAAVEEAVCVESTIVDAYVEVEITECETPAEEVRVVEETLCDLYVESPANDVSNLDFTQEVPEVQKPPVAEPKISDPVSELEDKGSSKKKKPKKDKVKKCKKGKRVGKKAYVIVDEPPAIDEPLASIEEPPIIEELPIVEESAIVEEQTAVIEELASVEKPVSEWGLALEPPLMEDDGWGTFFRTNGVRKERDKGHAIVDEPVSDWELAPEPDPVEDDRWGVLGTASKDRKKKGQSVVEDGLKMDVAASESSIEWLEAPRVGEAVKSSSTTSSFHQTFLAKITTTSPVIKTVVLKIVHTSRAGIQTLQTMVDLADNTKKAILDAVNHYLDHSSDVRYISSSRVIDIKFGSGKDGDLDLSSLEESRWPEYLEYLSQYTIFPELTVYASDGQR